MTRAEIQNCTRDDAWDLASFAQDNNIDVQGHKVSDIWDLWDDYDSSYINSIVRGMLDFTSIRVTYEYIKQAVEGNSRYVWEVKGFLVPFTEEDLEQLKEAVLEWMD